MTVKSTLVASAMLVACASSSATPDGLVMTEVLMAPDVAASPASLFPEGTVSRAGRDDLLDAPQYLAFRKSPTELGDASHQGRCVMMLPGLAGQPFFGNGQTCVIFNAGIVNYIRDQAARRAVMAQGFVEIAQRVNAPASAVGNRRIAVEVQIDLLKHPLDLTATYLLDLLAAARMARTPVFVAFDGINWLDHYFASTPGASDPRNIEWAGYQPSAAVRVGWRRWGPQIRLDQPIPALTSRVYRTAVRESYARLAPIVRAFYNSLAADERYLFGGLILGTELSVGVNYYHYPFGNSFAGQNPSCDPGLDYVAGSGCPRGTGACAEFNHRCPPDFTAGSLSGGVVQMGYRAALDLGALAPGQPMTRAVLDRIVSDYLGFLHHLALVEHRMPSHKIFAHTGGTFGGTMVHSLNIARVGSTVPGWSMYYGDTDDLDESLGSYLNDPAVAPLPWASPEWKPFDRRDLYSNWEAAYERSLAYRNNRMISVANWEEVSTNATAISAAHKVLTSPANCAMSPRVLLGTADLPSGTMLHFSRSSGATESFLNVATTDALGLGGTLGRVDSVNDRVTGRSSYSLKGRGGALFVQLVTDGCASGTYSRRVLSPIERITARSGTGSLPPPPYLFLARSGEHATFSWETLAGTDATYLNVSTDRTFAAVNAVNAEVSASQLYTWSGMAPGTRYYARLVVDGVGFGRRISNVIKLVR